MQFCRVCDNMYYLQLTKSIDSDPSEEYLEYYCRRCGDVKSLAEQCNELRNDEFLFVVGSSAGTPNLHNETQSYAAEDKTYLSCINEFTKHDPTLPRRRDIKCCNDNCETNQNNLKREIVMVRYDDINMKYCCVCSTCDHAWPLVK